QSAHEASGLVPIPDEDGDGLADLAFGLVRVERTARDMKRTVTRVVVLCGKNGRIVRDLRGDDAQAFAAPHDQSDGSGLFTRSIDSIMSVYWIGDLSGWMTSENSE